MELLFHISLIVIVALGVRLLLELAGRPRQLAEPVAMLVILIPVALALLISRVYTLAEMLVFVFSIALVGVFLLGVWFYILQPMADATETNAFQGLNLGTWNVRWDYLSLLLLAAPVFLLILTYNYFSGLFDFTFGRLLPLAVLGFIYYHAILRRW